MGRAPNVQGLGLEAVGVEFDKTGVTVNDRLQTTNPRIYAAGDVCSRYKFTHAADAMAQILIQTRSFHPFGWDMRAWRRSTCPGAPSPPEIAHVGLYEAEAVKQGLQVETYTYKFDEVDRAILDGDEEGFARLHIKAGTDTILGAKSSGRTPGT